MTIPKWYLSMFEQLPPKLFWAKECFMRKTMVYVYCFQKNHTFAFRTSLNSSEKDFVRLSECSLDSNVFKGSLTSVDCGRSCTNLTQRWQIILSKLFYCFLFHIKRFFMNRNSLTPYDAVVRKSKGLSSRKSFSMINIHHQKTPSPRSSLTRLDVNVSSASISSRPRSSLNIRDKNHISGPSLYSFHWRRRSTSFLQPRWAARKFR